MVRDGLVVCVAGSADLFPAAALQDRKQQFTVDGHGGDTAQIPADFLCNRGGEHAGIRSGIGRQFFLIKLLCHSKSLVRTDFEKSRAVILQLCQVVEERRILFFLFALDLFDHSRDPAVGCLSEQLCGDRGPA